MKNFKRFSRILAIVLVFAMVIPGMTGIVEAAPEDAKVVERLAGDTRVGTAVEASKKAYADGTETVVLAGYNGTVDALTGTLLAKAKDAPLLLTTKDKLSEGTEKEIKRLEAKSVYIVGGENVVSKDVENTLAKKYTVERISGERREETAQKIAEETGFQTGHVFLALGHPLEKDDALADALAIGPASAKKEMPVLLTQSSSLPKPTKKALGDLGVEKVTIIGGEKAISGDVVKELEELDIHVVERISGETREETALKIAEKYFDRSTKTIVAYGWNDADALVGGYLGAKIDGPILLANTDKIHDDVKEFLRNNTEFAYILGGDAVLSKDTFNDIESSVKTEEANIAKGHIIIAVEKFTLGQGYLREPKEIPFYKGDRGSNLLTEFLGEGNYKHGGSIEENFYLQKVKDKDGSEVNIPQYIIDNADEEIGGREDSNWLGEHDYTGTSGWMNSLNNESPNYGLSDYIPKDGDVVRVQFSPAGYGEGIGHGWGDTPWIEPANKDELTAKIAKINSAEDKDNILSNEEVKEAYDNAYEILGDMESSQESVDEALGELNKLLN